MIETIFIILVSLVVYDFVKAVVKAILRSLKSLLKFKVRVERLTN